MLLFISKAIIDIIRFILGLLPDWDIPAVEVPRSVVEIVNFLYYILPMDTISVLFGISVLITSFRVVLAIIYRVSQFIEVIK
ncbi:hypothetical protein [Huintestinicola butyrica]|uniref:hypothetical protein n=1 Tax=Huintestinicola butyrica TaxID=2981728 RepID=UPI003F8047F7